MYTYILAPEISAEMHTLSWWQQRQTDSIVGPLCLHSYIHPLEEVANRLDARVQTSKLPHPVLLDGTVD